MANKNNLAQNGVSRNTDWSKDNQKKWQSWSETCKKVLQQAQKVIQEEVPYKINNI